VTRFDGAHYPELCDDLSLAVNEMIAIWERSPDVWMRSRPGKWTGAQHAEHVALAMELPLAMFADRLRELRDGTVPEPPGRGPLQSLFFALVVKPGRFPRGGTAIPPARPTAAPERGVTERRLRDDAERYRVIAQGLDAAALDRLWIRNPFMTALRWHYRLPEMVRVHALHVRHHAALIREIVELFELPDAPETARGR